MSRIANPRPRPGTDCPTIDTRCTGPPPRTAGVAHCGLDPDRLEWPFAQDAPVAHAVQRHAAGQAQLFHAGLRLYAAGLTQHDLFADLLDRRGDVHIAPGDGLPAPARRAPEQSVEFPRRHGQALAVVEIRHIQAKRPVGLQVEQVVEDQVGIPRLAVRRQAHQLVFIAIDVESDEIGKRRIEQPERVGKVQLAAELDPVAASDAEATGGPFPDAVHGQDRRLVIGRGIEGAGRVRDVTLGEHILLPVSSVHPLAISRGRCGF